MKRYKNRKQIPNTLRCYYGVTDDDRQPDIVFNWGEGCAASDGRLVANLFCHERTGWGGEKLKSAVDELESRGYDISTLEFSIKKKI